MLDHKGSKKKKKSDETNLLSPKRKYIYLYFNFLSAISKFCLTPGKFGSMAIAFLMEATASVCRQSSLNATPR